MFSIETERLILRDLAHSDEPAMAALRMDPQVTRYIDYIHSDTAEQVHEWLVATMDHNARTPRLSWNLAIERAADGAVLGWIGIGRGSDPTRGDLDFGYALLPAYWGQGYTAEALRGLFDWCFSQLDIARIYGECYAANPRSAQVMRKAGMSEEPAPDPAPGALAERRFSIDRIGWSARTSS